MLFLGKLDTALSYLHFSFRKKTKVNSTLRNLTSLAGIYNATESIALYLESNEEHIAFQMG